MSRGSKACKKRKNNHYFLLPSFSFSFHLLGKTDPGGGAGAMKAGTYLKFYNWYSILLCEKMYDKTYRCGNAIITVNGDVPELFKEYADFPIFRKGLVMPLRSYMDRHGLVDIVDFRKSEYDNWFTLVGIFKNSIDQYILVMYKFQLKEMTEEEIRDEMESC